MTCNYRTCRDYRNCTTCPTLVALKTSWDKFPKHLKFPCPQPQKTPNMNSQKLQLHLACWIFKGSSPTQSRFANYHLFLYQHVHSLCHSKFTFAAFGIRVLETDLEPRDLSNLDDNRLALVILMQSASNKQRSEKLNFNEILLVSGEQILLTRFQRILVVSITKVSSASLLLLYPIFPICGLK